MSEPRDIPERSAMTLGLSVVIVTYNSSLVIGDAVRSINACAPDAEIIVVDNGSIDGTPRDAEDAGVAAVISGHGNVGYGAGVNLGVRRATRRHVLVVNPDVRIESIDTPRLVELFAAAPVGLVACDVRSGGRTEGPLFLNARWQSEVRWALFTWFLTPRWFNPRRRGSGRGDQAWVSGAAFLVSREEWRRVGGFDEAIFLYYEDFDLGRRYHAAQLPVTHTSALRVYHICEHSDPGRRMELVQSWALRSLLETTATWEGERAAAAAARYLLQRLAWIASLMVLAARIPGLGRRATRKEASVRAVRSYLLEESASGVDSRYYRAAGRALARAQTN